MISNLAPLSGNTVSISYILIMFLFIYFILFYLFYFILFFTHIRLIEFVFFVVFSFLLIYPKQSSFCVLIKNFF